MDESLNLYWIDMKYIRDLQNKDKRVYIVNPQEGKQTRPYLGVIIMIGGYNYCIPLTKFKEKYNNMTDRIDFSRIIVDGEVIAGINFSRMIPVKIKQLFKVDLKDRKHDSDNLKARKKVLRKEIEWCNDNKEIIVNKAKVLYNKYNSDEYFRRRKDCLNFKELEKICDKYNNTTEKEENTC